MSAIDGNSSDLDRGADDHWHLEVEEQATPSGLISHSICLLHLVEP